MTAFDPSKPVQTRDGRPARIICFDRIAEWPIVALIKEPTGGESLAIYDAQGQRGPRQEGFDLINFC